MKQIVNRNLRVPSLLLAAALQVLPIARAALPATQNAANIIVILFRWAVGSVAALGGVQAVSGASTAISTPLTGKATNGQFYTLRLITSPDQAHYWLASPLPPGIALVGTSGATLWKLEGTPTSSGVFNINLTAKDQSNSGPSRTVYGTLVLTIVGGANAPPSITSQPTNKTVTAGQTATFTVAASGSAPLNYRWRYGGANVSGGTNATLTLAGVTAGQAGNYDVVITNGSGSVTSTVAVLTVNLPPAITSQPQSQTVTEGQGASFSVAATGTAPLKFYWRKGATVVAANTTNSTYSIPATVLGDAGNYTVIASNVAGRATSSVAVLTVNAVPLPPSISSQPTNQTVVQGGTASFAVIASGTGPLNYQWRLGGSALSDKTNSTLSLPGVTAGQAGNYDVVVTNSLGSVTSSVAVLTVNVSPSITSQPQNATATEGQPVTFNVTADGTAPLKYFWRKGASVLAASANNSYSIAATLLADAGNYSVIVSNMAGSVTSVVATLTVSPVPQPPFISEQPTNRTVIQGANASFSVAAGGTGPLSYRWRFGGSVLDSETNSTLSLSSVTASQAGNYDVVITNSLGSVTSAVAVLTVNVPPSITAHPQNLTTTEGQSATFNVTATGTAPLKYFWRKGAVVMAATANNSFSIATTVLADAGNYSVIVSNMAGSVTSVVATLTVNPVPQPPFITSQPVSQTLTEGATASFSVVAGGTTPLNYQWRWDGNALAGQNGPSLTLNNLLLSQAGSYDVVVTNVFGSVTSSVAVLTVNSAPIPPSILAQPQSLSVTQGQDATFTVTATGTAPLSYFWRKSAMVIAPNAGSSFTIAAAAPASAGSYSVIVSNAGGAVTSLVATLAVITPQDPAFSAGSYRGLFSNAADVEHGSSGFFSATLKSNGVVSARLQTGLSKYSLSGRFDAAGQLVLTVPRRGTNALTVELQADLTGGQRITGRVTDGTWSSDLLARRAAFHAIKNPAGVLAGRYTLIVAGSADGGIAPLGDGCASLSVSAGGTATLLGSLADGSKLVQTVGISSEGDLPVYVPLNRGKGAAFGWLKLTPGDVEDLSGQVHWISPAASTRKTYSAGFHLASPVRGSVYRWDDSETDGTGADDNDDDNPFHQSSGRFILTGGNLAGSVTNEVQFGERQLILGSAPDAVKVKFSRRTGLFTGAVDTWASPRLIRFQGAVLQRQSIATGYFSGTNEVGHVYLGP